MARPSAPHSSLDDVSEPQTLGQVLSTLFAKKGYGRPQASRQLHEAWQGVAGEVFGPVTKVIGLSNRTLKVGVQNSAVLSELVAFRKGELLAAFQEKHPELRIRDIKFQLRSEGNAKS